MPKKKILLADDAQTLRERFSIILLAAADAKRDVRILRKTSHAFDHPINIYHPEGEYLKGLLCEVI